MKKVVMICLLAVFFISPVQAKDACKSTLCLAGMFQGSGVVKSCGGPVKDYFSIIKFKLSGAVSYGKTAKARGNFLKKCKKGGGWSGKLNNKYGRMLL